MAFVDDESIFGIADLGLRGGSGILRLRLCGGLRRATLLRADADAGVVGLDDDRAVVRRHATDGLLNEFSRALANGDDQVRGLRIEDQTEPTPFGDGFLDFFLGCLVGEWSLWIDAGVGIDKYHHRTGLQNVSGQHNLFLIACYGERSEKKNQQNGYTHANEHNSLHAANTPEYNNVSTQSNRLVFAFIGIKCVTAGVERASEWRSVPGAGRK